LNYSFFEFKERRQKRRDKDEKGADSYFDILFFNKISKETKKTH
jgi:hypothetical protein